MTQPKPIQDIALIADEYVLGLLDEDDRQRVDDQIEQNADLRAAISASRERFLPLDISVDAVVPSADLWSRIDSLLADTPSAENSQLRQPASNDNSRSLWKRTAIASLAATVLLAAGLGWSLMRTAEPVVIAILLNEAGEPQAIVEDFSNEHARIRLLADFTVPEGKTMQVWTLPNRDMGPISLGLLDEHRSASLETPRLPKPTDKQLYEITLEETGGSPTGRPTGPILVKGLASAIR